MKCVSAYTWIYSMLVCVSFFPQNCMSCFLSSSFLLKFHPNTKTFLISQRLNSLMRSWYLSFVPTINVFTSPCQLPHLTWLPGSSKLNINPNYFVLNLKPESSNFPAALINSHHYSFSPSIPLVLWMSVVRVGGQGRGQRLKG